MLTLIVLSCSVAADATAVAIAAAVRGMTLARGLAMAATFGAAQSIMAGLGWLGGAALGDFWRAWDHWVALVLLSFVGIKMIREAFQPEDEREEHGGSSLFLLAIATSLDSLAVGVSLPTLAAPPLVSVAMIGIVTFLFSAAGAAFGRALGRRFGRIVEVLGGLGLIAIGLRIAFEHTAG